MIEPNPSDLSIQEILKRTEGAVDGYPVFRLKEGYELLAIEVDDNYSVEIEFAPGHELSVTILKERESRDCADVVHTHSIDLDESSESEEFRVEEEGDDDEL